MDSRWIHPRTLAAALLLACLAGCAGGPRLYVNPQADMAFYRRVAILPFTNLTQDRYAGERVSRAFVTELVMVDRFQVVEPNEVAAALEKVGGMPGMDGVFDPEKVKSGMDAIKVTGLIRGAVTEYSTIRNGQDEIPSLSFDVEMIDIASGATVWRTSMIKQGRGRLPIIGGSGQRTFSSLIEEACIEVVERLNREAF
ncbi:MAG: hypothetical protein HZB25_04845 [Candidatus Eisenbacteria bacterium]|nr:hypothetical protein [Candidatus Eisenbacteria bacterium]